MSVSKILDSLRSGRKCGAFRFGKGDVLRDVVRRECVPKSFGVYLVSVARGHESELVYIGKAGTLLQSGQFGEQGLAGRVVNKQDGKARELYFLEKMAEERVTQLHVEWIVTHDGETVGVPPFFAEAQLLNAYHAEHGCLPRWNKSA